MFHALALCLFVAAADPPIKLITADPPAPVPQLPPIHELRLVASSAPGKIGGDTTLKVNQFASFASVNDKTIWDVTPLDSTVSDCIITAPIKPGGEIFGCQKGDTEVAKYTVPEASKGVYIVFAKKPGRVTIKAFDTTTKALLQEHRLIIEGGVDPNTPIVPVTPITPKPKPEPVVPVPGVSAFDQGLLDTIKSGIAFDTTEYAKWKGDGSPASAKLAIAGLGDSYAEVAAMLTSTTDPAAMPKTWGDVLSRLYGVSTSKKVPNLPALQKTRTAIASFIGSAEAGATLESVQAKLDKFAIVAATLKEAAK